MTRRKLYQSGNSVVVAVPTYMLEELGLQVGDQILFMMSRESATITYLILSKYDPEKPPDHDHRFDPNRN